MLNALLPSACRVVRAGVRGACGARGNWQGMADRSAKIGMCLSGVSACAAFLAAWPRLQAYLYMRFLPPCQSASCSCAPARSCTRFLRLSHPNVQKC